MGRDPSLERTYRIEIERDELVMSRMIAAASFVQAGLSLSRAKRPGIGRKILWWAFWFRRAQYSAACAVVDALEKYHMDAHLLVEVKENIANADRERRDKWRERRDDKDGTDQILISILEEIRALRDKIDPPRPQGDDSTKARQEMNALRDQDFFRKP